MLVEYVRARWAPASANCAAHAPPMLPVVSGREREGMRATDPPEAPVNRTSLFLISVLSIILGILLGRLERRKERMCLFENFVFGVRSHAKVLFKLEPECGVYFGPTEGAPRN